MRQPLDTPRLRLKPMDEGDRGFVLSVFSNPAVTRYLFDEDPITGMEGAERIIRLYIAPEAKGQHRWILVRRADGVKMGTCGLHQWDEAARTVDIGYDLLPAYQGSGYMREAAQAVIDFARRTLGASAVHAHIAVENGASIALAERLGFAPSDEEYMLAARGGVHLHRKYVLRLPEAKG